MRKHQPRAARKQRTQLCLVIWGPIVDGRRDGSRRLVPAAEGRRRARLSLRLLRPRLAGACARDERHGARPRRLPARRRDGARCAPWWPLAALTLLAAVLRLSTLGLQSFWYDEAFTPVHVLHAGLVATLHAVVHTENTPPLWYVLEWADSRVLGTGAVALRLLSALAGSRPCRSHGRSAASSPAVAPRWRAPRWSRSTRCSCGTPRRRARTRCSCCSRRWRCCASCAPCVRARPPTQTARWRRSRSAASLALLTHYFAVFLLVPMVLWLALEPRSPPRVRCRRSGRWRSSVWRCCR